LRQTDEVLFWINEKVAFVTADEFGHDLEHVEVLQRKFDEFQKDMATQVSPARNLFPPGDLTPRPLSFRSIASARWRRRPTT
jgi:hypothetical protein